MKTYATPALLDKTARHLKLSAAPRVVRSLLEQDLYKLTMQQQMLHKHPGAQAEYEFVCRNKPAFPLSELAPYVNQELDHLCSLRYTQDELDYLRGLRYMKSDYIDFLSIFQLQRRFITAIADGDDLRIVATGPQVHVMVFEIFVLYIVSTLYFRCFDETGRLDEAKKRLDEKVELLKAFRNEPKRANPFELSDFGLRRRYSSEVHDMVVERLVREVPDFFKGTSDVYLAKKFNLVPIGTMAHEYVSGYQAFGVRLRDFQKAALEDWVQEYRGELGVALTDTIGMDAFLEDFDRFFCLLFEGIRHDSGDPFVWGEKAIAHYHKMRINPMTKRFTWSDGLDLEKAFALYRHFADRVMTGFGIGTNLTNDTGMEPLNLVMKLVRCNGQPVAKLSDAKGKTMCKDETFIAYLRQVFNHYN